MDCLVLPVSILRRWSSTSRLRYRTLESEEGLYEDDSHLLTVVVGKEKRVFLVHSFVLKESPFRVLINAVAKDGKRLPKTGSKGRAILVDVDALLFEHMLWLLHNDSSSLFELNVEEIVDFYGQEN